MLFFILFALASCSTVNPLDKNFNFSDTNGYVINGSIRIVTDTLEFGRISDLHGNSLIGVSRYFGILFYLDQGGRFKIPITGKTLNWNNQQFSNGAGCAQVDWTFADEVAGYSLATTTDNCNGAQNEYTGNVYDSNGCGRPISVKIKTVNVGNFAGVILSFQFSQAYIVPITANYSVCAMISGYMDMYENTARFDNATITNYFNDVPSVCSGPNVVDFCAAAYPANNVCDMKLRPVFGSKRTNLKRHLPDIIAKRVHLGDRGYTTTFQMVR